jgi:rare lipoprotein A (peptidoglycan hydrolase)
METQAKKMADVVKEAKSELNIPDDQINSVLLSSQDEVHSGQEIKVTRITTENQIEQQEIYPDTIYVDDWESPVGSENVLEWGSNGTKELVYEVNFEDGTETNRILVGENIVTEPQPKKVAIGRKQPEITYTTPAAGGDVGTASWYSYGSTPTCAHRTYPKGMQLLVTNNSTGASIVVTVNDYGPQAWTGRIIDLNSVAFSAIAPLSQGLMEVTVTPI